MKIYFLCLLCVSCVKSDGDVPVVCGGSIVSDFQADFTKVKVMLVAKHTII